MKKIILFCLVMGVFAAGIMGCAGPTVTKPAEPALVPMDTWLEKDAFNSVVEHLRTNTFMKELPFIVVKARGEIVSNRIDNLTEDIRDRLYSIFLEYPDVRLVRRHPAPVIERPYTLQDIRCGRYEEHKMLLTIDIKRLGRPEDNLARVNIRAIDRKKDNWISGFSIHEEVALTSDQSTSLDVLHPDEYLRGLKYVPFTKLQRDEMAAYLARNLSCVSKEAFSGKNINVYIDLSKVRRKNRDIPWFIQKQLQFCNEIQMVDDREKADLILEAESRETGSGTGLCQFWITALNQRGMATNAYFMSGKRKDYPLTGRWEIRDLPGGALCGFLEITGVSGNRYHGDLFGLDRVSLRKRGIVINLRNRNVDWTYYDDRANKTFEVRGVLLEDGERMAVNVSSFPSSGKSMKQELVLVD